MSTPLNPLGQSKKTGLSSKLVECLSNTIFPELDTQLRAGKHICPEDMEKHTFIQEYFTELDNFYRRYHVELIHAPENFFYLRTKSTSIIASSQLSELEMMVGKILCLLHLSPEHLAQQGIFSAQEVYEELTAAVPVERLVKLINPRSTGSDLDKVKLFEKLRSALGRLARIGIISYLAKDRDHNRFFIRSSCFRFGAEVRTGEDPLEQQEKLIRSGEIVTKKSLAEAEAALNRSNQNQDEVEQQQAEEDALNEASTLAGIAAVATGLAAQTPDLSEEDADSSAITEADLTAAELQGDSNVLDIAEIIPLTPNQEQSDPESEDFEDEEEFLIDLSEAEEDEVSDADEESDEESDFDFDLDDSVDESEADFTDAEDDDYDYDYESESDDEDFFDLDDEDFDLEEEELIDLSDDEEFAGDEDLFDLDDDYFDDEEED